MDDLTPEQSPALRVTPEGAAARPVDALICGHLTRDLVATEPAGWRVGGTALYAAVTAHRLGLTVGVVTSAPPDVIAAAREALDGVALAVVPCVRATTFENIYTEQGRRQYVRGVAAPLRGEHVPLEWRACRVALLAPVADEVDPALVGVLGGAVVGATPQGWLRRWDGAQESDPGRVRPRVPGARALDVFARLDALILSVEDVAGAAPDAEALRHAAETLREWARRARLLAVTRASEGADLYLGDRVEHYPAMPAREVDPTGAGDVFAMSLLWALSLGQTPRAAVTLANRVAALSVEGAGWSAIPTRAALRERYPDLALD